MSKKLKKGLACPTCHKAVTAANSHFPFCSDRCRLIDLGKWASGQYRISTPIPPGGEFDEEALGGASVKSNISDDELLN